MKQDRVLAYVAALAAAPALLATYSCGGGESISPVPPTTITLDFTGGNANGVGAVFFSYPVGQESFYELESGIRTLPFPLDQHQTGFLLSGNNHSDSLNMTTKIRLTGLKTLTTYKVTFQVKLATNVPHGCLGIGGSPGEAVVVWAAANAEEPQRIIEPLNWYTISALYKNRVDLGDISNSQTDCFHGTYEPKTLASSTPYSVTTDAQGSSWALIGTRSGFEGKTTLYYTELRLSFR